MNDWWETVDDREWDLFYYPDEEDVGDEDAKVKNIIWPEKERLPYEWEDWEE